MDLDSLRLRGTIDDYSTQIQNGHTQLFQQARQGPILIAQIANISGFDLNGTGVDYA